LRTTAKFIQLATATPIKSITNKIHGHTEEAMVLKRKIVIRIIHVHLQKRNAL